MVNALKLWEVVNIRTGRRVSLHWTLKAAEVVTFRSEFMMPRLRTLPRWTRPLHRLILW